MAERRRGLLAALTKRRLKRGAFVGVVDLQAAINRYVAHHNTHPKPFRWKADPDKIIAAASRGPPDVGFNPLDAENIGRKNGY